MSAGECTIERYKQDRLANVKSHEDKFVSLPHCGARRSGEGRTVCIHGEQHHLCPDRGFNWLVLGFFSSTAGMGPNSCVGVWQSRRIGSRQCEN